MAFFSDEFKQNLLQVAGAIVPISRGCFYEVDARLEPRRHVVLGGDTRWIKPYDTYRACDPFHPRYFSDRRDSIFTSRDRLMNDRTHATYIENFMRPIGLSHKVELFFRDAQNRIIAGMRLGRTTHMGDFESEAIERLALLRPVIEKACVNVVPAGNSARFALTHRENQVMDCLLDGLPDKLIARRLRLSLPTVKLHARSIYRKLGVRGRAEAVIKIYQAHST